MNARARLTLLCLLPAALAAGEPMEGVVVPYRQVEVCAPVSSFIVELKVKEGEPVKAGQPLALLYGKLEELEMQRAKMVLTRREYEAKAAKNLYANKVIPETKALESGYELEMARLNYETAMENVKLRTILAPIDGLVVEKCRDLGEAVSSAQPVFRILDFSKVIVLCAVKSEKMGRLTVGQKVNARIPQLEGAPTFPGEIVLVDPHADSAGLFRVKVLVDNPDLRIRVGLKAVVAGS